MGDARQAVLGVLLAGCGFDSGGVAGGGDLQSTSSADAGSTATSSTAGGTAETTTGTAASETSVSSSDVPSTSDTSDGGSSGSPTTGTSTGDSGDEPPAFGPFAAPVELAEINTGESDDDPTLSPDLLEIYWASLREGGEGSEDIWRATRTSRDDTFGLPMPVAALNGPAQDGWPELAHDGLVLTLASDRTGGEGGFDIYVSVRATLADEFGEPVHAADLSTPENEAAAALSSTMLEAFLCSPLAAISDLQLATRVDPDDLFAARVPIDSLNSIARDCTPFIDQGGTRVLFSSDRFGSMGAMDIWTAERTGEGDSFVGEPETVAALNSTSDDDDPWWAPDGSAVYFSSSRANGSDLDLWVALRE